MAIESDKTPRAFAEYYLATLFHNMGLNWGDAHIQANNTIDSSKLKPSEVIDNASNLVGQHAGGGDDQPEKSL